MRSHGEGLEEAPTGNHFHTFSIFPKLFRMYQQEKITPYSNNEKKSQQVEEMFDNIAPTYDTLNHRLSWNIDKMWRNRAINALQPSHPQRMLDIATGTGDFAILAARKLQPKQLIGADISEEMMRIGAQKVKKLGLDSVWHSVSPTTVSMPSPQRSASATSRILIRD